MSGNRFVGSPVEPGNGSFDAVLVGVSNGSLLAVADSGVPKTLSAELVVAEPKGSSLPNGVDEVVAGPLSNVLPGPETPLLSSDPKSLPVADG